MSLSIVFMTIANSSATPAQAAPESSEPNEEPVASDPFHGVEEFSEVVVIGSRRGLALDSSKLSPQQAPLRPPNLTRIVAEIPGLEVQGQGGDFQTYSIRGVGRQRVVTRIADTPIISERRAGAAVSFVDPALMGPIEIIRGPASTHYGSGALGGVVQISPLRRDAAFAEAHYESNGNLNAQIVGSGGKGWSAGFARRAASDGETPNGDDRFSRFERLSGLLATRGTLQDLDWEMMILPAIGWSIGKPNLGAPERMTRYPRERHLVGNFSLTDPEVWRAAFYVHPNDLETEVTNPTSFSRLDNEAVDFGFTLEGFHDLGNEISLTAGFDYSARRAVTARERITLQTPLGVSMSSVESLSDGHQDELGLRLISRWHGGPLGVEMGVRGSWVRQGTDDHSDQNELSANAFLGGRLDLPHDLSFAANVSTGLRFPSLSERFFSGVTGRGQVIGNSDLDSERSVAVDGKLAWSQSGTRLAISGFYTYIDDYIERIDVSPGVRSFRNLTSGSIFGLEAEAAIALAFGSEIFVQGHWMRGRTNHGDRLADIPVPRLSLGLRRRVGQIQGWVRYQRRFAKDDPGDGEVFISDADVLSAEIGVRAWKSLWLSVEFSNLTDERYQASADDEAMAEARRSIGLTLSWAPDRRSEAAR